MVLNCAKHHKYKFQPVQERRRAWKNLQTVGNSNKTKYRWPSKFQSKEDGNICICLKVIRLLPKSWKQMRTGKYSKNLVAEFIDSGISIILGYVFKYKSCARIAISASVFPRVVLFVFILCRQYLWRDLARVVFKTCVLFKSFITNFYIMFINTAILAQNLYLRIFPSPRIYFKFVYF